MDTDKQNNVHVNAFTKGMNTDTSLDMVNAEQYVFGQNIRITNNALLNALIDANSTEGIVTPVDCGESITVVKHPADYTEDTIGIMAVATIENEGAIITKSADNHWNVHRLNLKDDVLTITHLFTSSDTTDRDRFSVVINKELEDKINLYIADTKHPVMVVDLYSDYTGYTEDELVSNNLFPVDKILIVKLISGSLRTSQVQYAYRYYRKHGISSNVSPLTNKIQIIDNNRNKETGNAENTQTSVGLQLKLLYNERFRKLFDHVQIFRLSYIKAKQNAEIDLIYDTKLPDNDTDFILNDNGIKSLQSYSIDEFASLNGLKLIPQIIEQNQNYLFASNIEDLSVLKFKKGEFDSKAISFRASGLSKFYSDSLYEDYITVNSPDDFFFFDDDIDLDTYYLNKDSDINNINSEQSISSVLMYDGKGSIPCFGGFGRNISYNLVCAEILVHENIEQNTKTPVVTNKTKANSRIFKFSYNGIGEGSGTIKNYLQQSGINVTDDFDISYDNIITSSMLRSLRRNEVYRYGIVLYNEHGSRSDVMWIADIRTPSENDFSSIIIKNGNLYVRPIGLLFEVNIPEKLKNDYNIVGYQIVRCLKTSDYTKNLLQCVLSRPIHQGKYKDETESYRTPYYPNVFLTTQFMYVVPSSMLNYGNEPYDLWKNGGFFLGGATNCDNDSLFLIFSPEIDLFRLDTINTLSQSDLLLLPINYVYGESYKNINEKVYGSTTHVERPLTYFDRGNYTSSINNGDKFVHNISDGGLVFVRNDVNFTKADKASDSFVFFSYNYVDVSKLTNYERNIDSVDILNVSDVSNATWEQGITNVQLNGDKAISAIKQYKSYMSTVGTELYVNWVINGMYDLAITKTEADSLLGNDNDYLFKDAISPDGIKYPNLEDGEKPTTNGYKGWIGPGPTSLLIKTESPVDNHILNSTNYSYENGNHNPYNLGSVKCNIQHTAMLFAGLTAEEKQYDTYYGFGNFRKVESETTTVTLFDGDIYILPFEIVNLFKTYNFNTGTTLYSTQIVYYIPLESRVNTFFDYGRNYKNTLSSNLQSQPGAITGIASQDRPLHQYNPIYSENDVSLDVYSAELLEDVTNKYPHRIFYSERKTNGEIIDSWHVYKPVDFIDADTRYGSLTNLFTVKDILYFWLTGAFGKLSVNERSLITDNNSNTILLGQGGVLQRTDYLDTKYGMRELDFVATDVDGSVVWIDMYNKAIVAFSNSTINLSEQTNVQNIVNSKINEELGTNRPTINYDVLNNEVLCKCLENNDQLIFNLKGQMATSIYTRRYDRIANFNNILFGLNTSLNVTKYNYLDKESGYLSPVQLSFVVNNVPSTTKVFDNLKIVTLKHHNDDSHTFEYFKNIKYKFTTDLYDTDSRNIGLELISDREGNICYAIPRVNDPVNNIPYFGQRLRGKWMRVDIVNNNPEYEFAISHVITKIRLSFS